MLLRNVLLMHKEYLDNDLSVKLNSKKSLRSVEKKKCIVIDRTVEAIEILEGHERGGWVIVCVNLS